MSVSWAEVDKQLSAIQTALASGEPDVAKASRILEPLQHKVRARAIENARTDAPRRFSEGELMKAVRHQAFETWMFRCLTRIRRDGLPIPDGTARQALGYALLIHIRVLADFFYSRSSSFDDCHIHHFNAIPNFETVLPPTRYAPTAEITKLGRALDKMLAHFTSARWEEERPS